MNEIDVIYKNSKTKKIFALDYLKYTCKVLSKISVDEVEEFIKVILEARDRGSSIYFAGNGGSSSTASHFANDMAIGTRVNFKPFKAFSLCDNQAIISAISNDYGYEYIFSKQLDIFLQADDVVVVISASGNSENLVNAVKTAHSLGAITVALTSFDGGKLKEQANLSIHIPANTGEYGPAEDGHSVINHLVGSFLNRIAN
ncbi:SIS domain-containing protein [bacterium]|jgi:D-sedoheptulose 7-phosphate isomerase|nr:SIS domain-containing protein [bacterium]